MSKAITLSQLVSAVASIASYIKSAVSEGIKGKANAAPKDGKPYVQKDGEWVELPKSQDVEFASDDEVKEAIDKIFKS